VLLLELAALDAAVEGGLLEAVEALELGGGVVRREAWLPPFDVANRYERDRATQGRSDP
jgi:hypothetical protein